jgi:hypothetical protein
MPQSNTKIEISHFHQRFYPQQNYHPGTLPAVLEFDGSNFPRNFVFLSVKLR